MDLQYEVTRKRKEFGVHPKFGESKVVHFDQENDISVCNDFVEIPQKTREFDCIPQYSSHAVNTEAFIQESVGVHHVEGGWPENINQPQDKQRFLRKIEADSGFSRVCCDLVKTLKQVVDSNLTIDLYKPYLMDLKTISPLILPVSILYFWSGIHLAPTAKYAKLRGIQKTHRNLQSHMQAQSLNPILQGMSLCRVTFGI